MSRIGWMSCVVLAGALVAPDASAYELKHTDGGKDIRWGTSSVSFVVDPSLEDAVAGGSAAAVAAVSAWSGADGAPSLSTTVGSGGATVKLDGQNSIVFMPDGYPPAGN